MQKALTPEVFGGTTALALCIAETVSVVRRVITKVDSGTVVLEGVWTMVTIRLGATLLATMSVVQGSVVTATLEAAAETLTGTEAGAEWTTAGLTLECGISSVQGSVVATMLGAAATVTGAG